MVGWKSYHNQGPKQSTFAEDSHVTETCFANAIVRALVASAVPGTRLDLVAMARSNDKVYSPTETGKNRIRQAYRSSATPILLPLQLVLVPRSQANQ